MNKRDEFFSQYLIQSSWITILIQSNITNKCMVLNTYISERCIIENYIKLQFVDLVEKNCQLIKFKWALKTLIRTSRNDKETSDRWKYQDQYKWTKVTIFLLHFQLGLHQLHFMGKIVIMLNLVGINKTKLKVLKKTTW